MTNPYASPADFRRALTDRLREKSRTSRWNLNQLQRQMAYDRLLERLYATDDRWVVKGATALIARDIGVRGTLDIDIYRESTIEATEAAFREAAARDIGDWFRFELGLSQVLMEAGRVVRVAVVAYLGTTPWLSFRVDLIGSGIRMTAEPEDVAPLAEITLPGFQQHGYRAYPLVDHITDKLAATLQVYGGPRMRPSTRYKDLVDLVAIVTAAPVSASSQRASLEADFGRRSLPLPSRFDVPSRGLWVPGYAAEARRSLLTTAPSLDEALGIVRPFVDPLLDGSAEGIWDPALGQWTAGR